MITQLSKPGGRQYPRFGSAGGGAGVRMMQSIGTANIVQKIPADGWIAGTRPYGFIAGSRPYGWIAGQH